MFPECSLPQVAEVIKKMLFKLKKVAPETLWEVYLSGMKKAFERYLENGQQSFHLAQFRELAHKISQVNLPVGREINH
jgi:hypothetical protein